LSASMLTRFPLRIMAGPLMGQGLRTCTALGGAIMICGAAESGPEGSTMIQTSLAAPKRVDGKTEVVPPRPAGPKLCQSAVRMPKLFIHDCNAAPTELNSN